MTLSQGRSYLAIPGPSVVPDRVLQAMHRAAPNIYEGALVELTHGLVPDLRRVACTQGEVAMYIANGHGAWEAALSNVVAAGERVVILSHVVLHPAACDGSTMVWDYEDALHEIHRSGVVMAVLCGHDHKGGFGVVGGVPCVTAEAILDQRFPKPMCHQICERKLKFLVDNC